MFVSHPAYLRDKARALRVSKRLTIDELAERLVLPRTTIFHWVRDLPIPYVTPARSAAQRRAARANSAKYRLLRDAAYAEGRATFAGLALEPTFRDFVTLFIAEGYKRTRHQVSIANSDSTVVALSVLWLPRLTDRRLNFSIPYHADQDLGELRAFWGRTLGIDGGEIKFLRKSNSGRLAGRSWRSRYGVISVTVNDTLLRSRMQGWVDSLKESWTRLDDIGV